MRLAKWFLLLGISASLGSSCSHLGPQITGCVVDVAHAGFDCTDMNDRFVFLSFSEGSSLICYPLDDFEMYLKSCATKMIIPTASCRYIEKEESFSCLDIQAHPYNLPVGLADNYFCITEKDKRRIDDRCR